MKTQAYDVYLNGKLIDTVFYTADNSEDDVRRSLIDHDGYDPSIVVEGPPLDTPCSKCGDSETPLHTNGVCGNCGPASETA